MKDRTTHDYDDIINLPHYEPKHHHRMPMWNRAAQFAPFAALTGYDAAIKESGRLTDDWTDIGNSANDELNRKMMELTERQLEHPQITIEYFVPDTHKSGGSFQTVSGSVKHIDDIERLMELTDGKKIPIDLIRDLSF